MNALHPAARRAAVALRSYTLFALAWWALSAWVANPIQLPDPLRVARALAGAAGERRDADIHRAALPR